MTNEMLLKWRKALSMHKHVLEAYKGKWTILLMTKDGKSYIDKNYRFNTKEEAEGECFRLGVRTKTCLKKTGYTCIVDSLETWEVDTRNVSFFMPIPVKD